MGRWLVNVALLSGKEFRSLLQDVTLMALIVFAFTAAVQLMSEGVKAEVSHASVAMMDGDHSELSRRLRDAILPPYFIAPEEIAREDVAAAMNQSRYIFVIEIPPRFEADVLAGRKPAVQVLVDATAMTQAGLGAGYLNEIFVVETQKFLGARSIESSLPIRVVSRIEFNPNTDSFWFTSVMQIVVNLTVLSIILVGAAVIREREHGTIEHLLVMPVRASEIAIAKIMTNGLVILAATMLSLWLVVQKWLGVPIAGSIGLFAFGALLYLFSVTSLGMWLATLAPTMPQFGLLSVPVYAIAYLLSGAATPVESMPEAVQAIVRFAPTTQFVSMTQAVLYRSAGLDTVWPQIAVVIASGAMFLSLALSRFRSMLARQG
ncbi:ABC transporter permease [Methylosinus sp. C49]|jgi:ABC-2 type transport system permease protein|uniref:ABC transporter permease n=1 Tax=Methylosinus sp. C49 TaxID=2699395 RepID=UPI00136746DF|nr:ABC transporter permease [Methylosinus sp. C49]BBU63262.1 ABC transporter permease [Methylosinus sp. C49]